MAWRVDKHLVRGEIDNRTRGRVTGRLWFAGRDEPILLDLAGLTKSEIYSARTVLDANTDKSVASHSPRPNARPVPT